MATGYESDCAGFVNPSQDWNLGDQLGLMRSFNAEFGMRVPILSRRQRYNVEATLDENPGYRLVPTALPEHVWERHEQYRPIKYSALPGRTFPGKLYNILHTLEEDPSDVSKVWADLYSERSQPLNVCDEPKYILGLAKGIDQADSFEFRPADLRYKTPGGEVAGRPQFLQSLLAARQAILGSGLVWTFPVMDVSDAKRPMRISAERIWEKVDPVVTTESRIMTQLIHAASGKPKNEDVTEFVNETVYWLDDDGANLAMRGVGGVTWAERLGGRIRVSFWNNNAFVPFSEGEPAIGVSGL